MKQKRFFLTLLFLVGVLAATALACSSSGGTPEAAEPQPGVQATQPEVQATQPKEGTSLEDVQKAVIQIEFLGVFRDPAVGAVSGSGFGSGFIIDPSGIAVTNNHVVAGAASLKVRIGGDKDKTYNAKILGVSECSDLAVIDIEGDGFPYLQWYEGDVSVGMDVYAAGFPLGEPEFTLTRGVVSKASAPGETAWASVDGVIGHDATINPGNSGGPLITKDGQVIGVNYSSRPDYDQYFAIGTEKAISITKQLSDGKDVDSIGLNGQAVISKDGSLTGVWVSSVVSGSPADKADLQGGDVIVKMEGVELAKDGTMADYCDILRSHNADDAMSIDVIRYDTKEGLEGQLNGEPLTQAFSFAAASKSVANQGASQALYGSLVKFKDTLTASGDKGMKKFTFIGVTDGEVVAYVKPEADLDAVIMIADASGKALAFADDAGPGGAERASFKNTGKMSLFAIAVAGKSSQGNYEGIFMGNDKTFFLLEPKYLVAGSLIPDKSIGYAYYGKAGETLNVILTSDPKAPMDVSVIIVAFSDLKTVLAKTNSTGKGGVETLSFPIPKNGVYIMVVSDAENKGGSFLMVTGTKK